MNRNALSMYMVGLLFFLGVLYLGLNLVELGLHDLMALDQPGRSFVVSTDNGSIVITFAARDFFIPYSEYTEKLYSFFETLKSWLVTRQAG